MTIVTFINKILLLRVGTTEFCCLNNNKIILKKLDFKYKMGDIDYEKEYLDRKKKLRKLHQSLKDTKHIQEIYHKIMGSSEGEKGADSDSLDDSEK